MKIPLTVPESLLMRLIGLAIGLFVRSSDDDELVDEIVWLGIRAQGIIVHRAAQRFHA
jgi:hypothetical protein